MKAQRSVGNLQAHSKLFSSCGARLGISLRDDTALAGIDLRTVLGDSSLALGFQLFRRAEAAIRLAFTQQAVGVLFVNRKALGLAIGSVRAANLRAFAPVETEPVQVFDELCLMLFLAALNIGIFNAQNVFPARMTGDQPVVSAAEPLVNLLNATSPDRK